jgi:membrane protein YqaA with SNARE-associated domain
MRTIAAALFAFVVKFGGIGLLVLGVLDSSFLFAPWGNDLLVVAMTARHREVVRMLYYAGMSAVGSVLGCMLIDFTVRPLGAKALERHVPARRLERVKKRMEKNAGRALAIASLAPPPFPFTAFVIGASALQYSRRRMTLIIGLTRMLRFTVLGALALRFGKSILHWSENPIVQGFLVALILVCTVGSLVSVYGWIKRARSTPAGRTA